MSAQSLVPDWLHVVRGDAPLIVSIPHAGTRIPAGLESRLVSPWLARKDTDWYVPELYDFAHSLGATVVRTDLSRTVIDVNRDPSGASLYPGQATTGLCPLTTFDGEPLYLTGDEPDAAEIESRRAQWFEPYHHSLVDEIERLQKRHGHVVLYEAHSIRSHVPRLFDGALPHFNLGTNGGASCDARFTACMERALDAAPPAPDGSKFTRVTNGRFRGGYTTRYYGEPEAGVHAVQMELACRGYLREPQAALDELNWPPPFDAAVAAPMRAVLRTVLDTCLLEVTR